MSNSIFETQDGSHSIFSEKFEVSYHSKYGAIQETQHVFIDAALRYKAIVQRHISILEIGFGTGLNALMTYREAKKRNLTIAYTAVEAYPVPLNQIKSLNYPTLLQMEGEDASFFVNMHQSPWNANLYLSEHFDLYKLHLKFEKINFIKEFDIIYFDAFAPNAQPHLWETDILAKMYNALLPGGVLVTYCAKGQVKRNLKAVGFEVESLKGPPGKREMTRALKPDTDKNWQIFST